DHTGPLKYQAFAPYLDRWLPERSMLTAPDTVAFTCFAQQGVGAARRLVVHLVNADRDRTPRPDAKGAQLEQPIPQKGIGVDLRLPADMQVRAVTLLSPERAEPASLEFVQEGRRLRFTVPEMLVYAVATIED
ncbi:MAG: hypothetical protein JXB46_00550, partial [Candidatus Eisenbacteria bacterium]|nr:hypothetical protein [Candidatus Eisenbacteria bacterium]